MTFAVNGERSAMAILAVRSISLARRMALAENGGA